MTLKIQNLEISGEGQLLIFPFLKSLGYSKPTDIALTNIELTIKVSNELAMVVLCSSE
jgi:hypothetical protein